MSKQNTTISSTQSTPRETDHADLREGTETQPERGDDVGQPVQELCVAVHKRLGNSYGSTNISNSASAVLGDVTHNYFYGGKVPYLAGLQVYQEGCIIEPDAISDYDAHYTRWLRSEQRLERTCEWIFERVAYKRWMNNTGPPILIVSGSVGSGKSITASAVIDKLTSQQENPRLVVSYFVDHLREQPTTCDEILRALVKQILQIQKASNEAAYKDFHTCLLSIFPSKQARPSAKAITHLLCDNVLKIGPCIFVIDGIDALPEKEIDEFLDFLLRLSPATYTNGPANKLVLFCRHSLGRGIRLETIPSSAHCEIRLDYIRRDLSTYVDHEIDFRQRRHSITADAHLIDEIKTALKTHCGKMFLWIRLQISSLWDPGLINCDDDIRQQLCSLPEGLDETYTRCLRRIENTYSKNSREIAPRLFKWVACAVEPLTQPQAREAVVITPQDIPLSNSKVLNTPAEDHCANLVALDEISGRVTFPHPSVKDFLRDPLKVPADLHHYLLSDTTDELWCGDICLAYAHYLHVRKQIVLHNTVRVQKGIANSLIKDVPGAWLTSLFRKSRSKRAFSLPTPSPVRKTEEVSEIALHDYMRRHWLSHSRRISPDAPNYSTFVALCLSQDLQLQPWTTERATEFGHYQKLFEFAIMTNHVPLLHAAVEYLDHTKAGLLMQVFSKGCPGTDSTWLHICAALGHQEIMQVVLRHCSTREASHGKSAAVMALEHGNYGLFRFLIPSPFEMPTTPVWHLRDNNKGLPRRQENLLRACAIHGNVMVLDWLLGRWMRQLSREYLSDALLHAWKYNSLEVADRIISEGASLEYLHLIERDKEYYMSDFSLDNLVFPTLFIALHLRDVGIWNALWTAKLKARASQTESENLLKPLVTITESSGVLDNLSVSRALQMLSQSSTVPDLWRVLGSSLTWFDIFVQQLQAVYTHEHFHAWNSILRKLLAAIDASCALRQILTLEKPQHQEYKFSLPTLHWLKYVPDDILVRVLKNNFIRMRHLLDPVVIGMLAQRWSSRGLEAWLESIGLERTLCRKQTAETTVRVCLSAALEETRQRHSHLLSYVNYGARLQIIRSQAIDEGRLQILDFLTCYEFANEDGATFGRGEHALQDMLSAWDVARHGEFSSVNLRARESQVSRNESTDRPLLSEDDINFPSTLTWLRLHSMNCGNKADKVQQKLRGEQSLRGMDGNFALNYPAGYDVDGQERKHHYPAATAAIGLPVRRCIVNAVYRWNDRLQGRLPPSSRLIGFGFGLVDVERRDSSFPDVEEW